MLNYCRQHLKTILATLPANRLLALDAFRGLTITAMILVNNPGNWNHVYAPLLHAEWHGWTITDLIFPFFIFIVGMSLQLSLQHKVVPSRTLVIRDAAIRSGKLILLGLFLTLFYYNFRDPSYNWFEQRLANVRWLGVLQRIGIVYFVTVLIVLCSNIKERIAWCIGLSLLYLLVMLYVPYQDEHGNRFQGLLVFGNHFSAWLDQLILGRQHVYYRTALPFAFDPEGIFTTLPAISSCLSGVLAAQWLQTQKTLIQKIRGLLLFGLIFVWAGLILDAGFPINKSLWTPTFVLLSSGYACLVLACCLWLCEVKQYRLWTAPFVVFGANAILFFMFAGVAARVLLMIPVADTVLQPWLYQHFYQPLFGDMNGSLVYALSFLMLSYILMHWCYRKGYIFKV